METFRGFIAINIKATPTMVELVKEIKQTRADIKLVEPKNIHVTLKFLGEVEVDLIDQIEHIIKDSIKNIQPFIIKLHGIGVFPSRNYIKVIWIGIKQVQIIESIANDIDEQLFKIGFKKEKRGFSPHLTIGRVKTAKNKESLINVIEKYSEIEFSKQEVHSIKLIKSDLTQKGPIYTTICDVTF
jgi:2'-5' RNA ligase